MANKKFSTRPYWDFHKPFFPVFSDEDGEWDRDASYASGLTIYEDQEHVVIEASMPGIPTENIHLSHHHGYLIIEGENEEEEKNEERKYYRRGSRSFTYRIPIPSHADETQEPEASNKNGVMTIKFNKTQKKGKKIPIKDENS